MKPGITPEACLAVHEGETKVAGTDGPITIVRDRWGVPHIRAGSTPDAFFGQGFCMAQDRAFQIELYRQMAHGRAAAMLNRGLLGLDRQNRRLGYGRLAAQDWEAQSADARAALQAYADGVNAAIATQPRPYEFHLIDHVMAPWSPVDSLAIIKMVNSGATWATKLKLAMVGKALGAAAVSALVGGLDAGAVVITPSGARWTGEDHPFKADIVCAMGEPDGAVAAGGGSNCWVIHGSKSATGTPLLAGDPHLAITVPGQWYVVHMECPEFTVAGPCNPGYPGPVFYGHNRHVGWVMTHAQGDRWDLYRERIRRGTDGPEALFKGEWAPLKRLDETFDVKDGEGSHSVTWLTRHGPVVAGNPETDDEVVAARWGLAEPVHDMDATLAMLRARSLGEAREALRRYDSVSGNYCFADTAGDVAYQYVGRIPKRPAWLLPVPGWDGEHEWQGDVPKDELPSETNPDNGFFVTANNRTTTPDYPHHLSFVATRFRADRLRELMDGVPVFDAAKNSAMQSDTTSVLGRALGRRFGAVEGATGDGERARAILASWDGNYRAESAAALLFDRTCEALVEATVRAFYARVPNIAQAAHVEERRVLFEQVLEGSQLMLGGARSWDDAIKVALGVGFAAVSAHYGPDTVAWRWDAFHQMPWEHNLGRDPELAALLNPPPVALPGDAHSPFSALTEKGVAAPHGVSFRILLDMGDVNGAQVCVPPGNSGQPGSPHYADELHRWRDVAYHPLFVDWPDIEANAEATLELIPG